MNGKNAILQLIKKTVSEYFRNDSPRLSAALSFYTLFSLAPLLLIIIVIVGYIYGRDAAEGGIVNRLTNELGEKSALLVQELIIAISRPSSSITATVSGILLSLYGASHVFNHLNISLNRIWNIKIVKKSHIGHVVERKFFLMILVIATGLFFLASLVISTTLNHFFNYLSTTVPSISKILEMSSSVISLGTTVIAFMLLFKFIPDARPAWEPVIIGSIFTAALFSIARLLLSLYFQFSIYSSVYNAAASFIILLLWLYYTSQIIFLGAQFIQIYSDLCGKPIKPAYNAAFTTHI